MKFNTVKSQSMLANVKAYLARHPGADIVAVAVQFGLTRSSAQRYLAAARPAKVEIPRFLALTELPKGRPC